MRRKSLTYEQFIDKAIDKHGDKYDYSKTIYENMKTSITIICPIHGEFIQSPSNHIYNGYGCKKCGNVRTGIVRRRPITKEKFLEKVKIIHGNKFDYTDTMVDVLYRDKIKVKCLQHGIFELTLGKHLSGQGCKQCANDKRKIDYDEFIKRVNQIYEDGWYDYSKVIYKDMRTKIIIYCKKHGYFEQFPYIHISGKGCKKCGLDRRRINWEKFLQKAVDVHGHRYIYNECKIDSILDKVIIICRIHGEFKQLVHSHIYNNIGCPKCRYSKGEIKIQKVLKNLNIKFIYNKTFEDLRNEKTNWKLSYDFFLPENKILIEFDGEQHFRPVSFSRKPANKKDFIEIQRRDKLKTKYAKNNGFRLLRIPYYDIDNIKNILIENLKEEI